MIITVTQFGAAKSQLIEAIKLFFEERDPVSIHTLVGASLNILHDHIKSIDTAWKTQLVLDYRTLCIKEKDRKIWANKVRDSRNFFKHAEKNIKQGRWDIDFDTDMNHFYIMESIICFGGLEGKNFVCPPEMALFIGWFVLKYPDVVNEALAVYSKGISHIDPTDFQFFKKVLRACLESF